MVVADEGFYYGLGVFETIAVDAGKALLLPYHMERMHSSLKRLGIARAISQHEIETYIATEGIEDAAVKIAVSQENLFISHRENPYSTERCPQKLSLALSETLRNETSLFTYHKTLNYGENILARRKAIEQGHDDAVFLNTKNEVTECSASNLFFVTDGIIHTPHLDSGLLPGVIRRYVLEREQVVERAIAFSEITSFQEAFVTNSLMGIMPVERIADCTFPEDKTTLRLRAAYLDEFGIV